MALLKKKDIPMRCWLQFFGGKTEIAYNFTPVRTVWTLQYFVLSCFHVITHLSQFLSVNFSIKLFHISFSTKKKKTLYSLSDKIYFAMLGINLPTWFYLYSQTSIENAGSTRYFCVCACAYVFMRPQFTRLMM